MTRQEKIEWMAVWAAKRERPPEHEILGWRGIAREINMQRKGGGE